MNNTSVDVRRGSQVHHTPHVGRAQIIPSISVRPVNAVATSAADDARRSSSSRRFQRYFIANTSTVNGASIVIHADGTWTYMIFCKSPMSRSGGEIAIAITCDRMRKRNANHPKMGQRPERGT